MVAQPWKHVNEIAKRFMKMGNTVQVLTDYFPDMPRDEEIDGVPIHRINKGTIFFDFKDLLKHLNEDTDIINWISGPLSAIYFWRMQNSLTNDVVWTLYKGRLSFEEVRNLKTYDFVSLYKVWTNILYSISPNFILKRGADSPQVKALVTWSERLKNYLQHIGIKDEKIAVISSGVDTETFKPLKISSLYDQKETLGFGREDPVILYFGPLNSFRGADTLISAMSTILERIPSAKLLMLARASSDDTKNSLENIAETHKAIRLLRGVQKQEKLIEYLALSDVVVLPFRFWPHMECPLTVLEAMAMEKPVITTSAGVIPEIVSNGETGILVTPGKPHEISQAAVKLLMDRDLAETMGKSARSYVKNFHDWSIIVQQTSDVFQRIMRS
jgi:glycosyltransferase involved in cell wall biosynthesis